MAGAACNGPGPDLGRRGSTRIDGATRARLPEGRRRHAVPHAGGDWKMGVGSPPRTLRLPRPRGLRFLARSSCRKPWCPRRWRVRIYESLVAAMQRALGRLGEAVTDSVAAAEIAKAP